MRTYSAKPTDVNRKWYVIDASEAPLGRLATAVARLLTGKDKPMYTPHIDCGDYVIVTNADNLVVTGKKSEDKKYYSHSGYPGSIKSAALKEKLQKDSTKVIEDAVRGMLPANKLRSGRLSRLKIYAGAEHANEAQKPQQYSVSASAKATTDKKEGK